MIIIPKLIAMTITRKTRTGKANTEGGSLEEDGEGDEWRKEDEEYEEYEED